MHNSLIASAGKSNSQHAESAGFEAAQEAQAAIAGLPNVLVIAFVSSWFDPAETLQGILSVFGAETPLVGCTTAGEISASGPITHGCVLIALATSDATPFWKTSAMTGLLENPRQTGNLWARKLIASVPIAHRSGCLLFGDGLFDDYTFVHAGIKESIGLSAPICGLLAGDDLKFKQTSLFENSNVYSNALTGCIFLDPVQVSTGISHGFVPISKPRKITASNKNRIISIDKKPAVAVMCEYFGKDSLLLMHKEPLSRQNLAFPMGIQDESSNSWTLRHIRKIDRQGALWCNAEVPNNHWMQLMVANRSELLESSRKAARSALDGVPNPKCILIFSSFIRQRLLGADYARDEIDAIRKLLPHQTPIAGCYSYGEINPSAFYESSDTPMIQSGSLSITAIGHK